MDKGIVIADYDQTWPQRFADEASRLRQAFGDRAVRIDHVGSTSVPGLAAKPVIDIQLSVVSLDERDALSTMMEKLAYTHIDLGAFDEIYPFFKRPAEWPSSHHVHLCISGADEERRHLAFRDYLRAHRMVAEIYADLKRKLAKQFVGTTADERERYSLGKTEFVERVLTSAFDEGFPAWGRSDG